MRTAQKGQTWLRFLRRAPVVNEISPHTLDNEQVSGRIGETEESHEEVLSSVPGPRLPASLPARRPDGVVIHPLACVDPAAQIGEGCEIGPFCVVGPEVVLGPNNKLFNNVTILGKTTIGASNLFFPNACIGMQPQDKKFKGETTRLEIGDHNHFRENCTVHLGTDKGGGLTKVGSHNLLMVNCHIAHDVRIANHCVISNNVMIAGHCQIGSGVVLSGGVAMHHFVTIDDFVYAAGYTEITHDVPPFVKVDGSDRIRGLNAVGLRRNNIPEADIQLLEGLVYRMFLDRDRPPLARVLAGLEAGAPAELASNPHVQRVVAFMRRRTQARNGRQLEAHR